MNNEYIVCNKRWTDVFIVEKSSMVRGLALITKILKNVYSLSSECKVVNKTNKAQKVTKRWWVKGMKRYRRTIDNKIISMNIFMMIDILKQIFYTINQPISLDLIKSLRIFLNFIKWPH